MKLFTTFILLFCILSLQTASARDKAIIIDHNNLNLTTVPPVWFLHAKEQFRIAYGHTSHGSQIVTGMEILKSKNEQVFNFNNGEGSLYLNDASTLSGDLGNPNRTEWADATRDLLNNNTDNINVVMWSWCGQVDGTQTEIQTYLDLMNQLENDFPNVTFIYMTGHLNGTGVDGNVNQRNEQIRNFCKTNNKVLFDFADIESYDPDGNYFLDKGADDGCNYNSGNWAEEWCQAHPDLCSTDCSCAHSHCLNCQMKGMAFWWMMARLSGWDGLPSGIENGYSASENQSIHPNPCADYIEVNLSEEFMDNYVDNNIHVMDIFGAEKTGLITNYSGIPADGKLKLDISALPVGTYFLKAGRFAGRFLKVN